MLFGKIGIIFKTNCSRFFCPSKKNAIKLIQGILKGNASLKAIAKGCIDKRAPSSFARFLHESVWEPFELNRARVLYFQKLKQLRAVKQGIISIDDYISEKSGENIKSAGWHYSHSKHRIILGQNVVVLQYWDDKKDYPINYGVYMNKKCCEKEGRSFKTRLEIASELINDAHFCGISGQTVVMDSWYVSKKFIDELTGLGYHWVGRLKSNRICYENGVRLNLRELGKLIPDNLWRKARLPYPSSEKKDDGNLQYICCRSVELSGLGKIKVVFVKKSLDAPIKLFLGSDRFDLTGSDLLCIYAHRWRIETFFRDCKQNLNLSGYMGRSYIGFEKFLYLVFTAYCFIKYLSLIGHWGRNALKRCLTFGEALDNYHQLCLECFVCVIYDVSFEIGNKSELLSYFRKKFYTRSNEKLSHFNDHVFYDLKSDILAYVG